MCFSFSCPRSSGVQPGVKSGSFSVHWAVGGSRLPLAGHEPTTRCLGWVTDDFLLINLMIAGTPYEGGYFRIHFDFGLEYPNLPPKCKYDH